MDPHSLIDNVVKTHTDMWKLILQLMPVVAPITFPGVCPQAKCSRWKTERCWGKVVQEILKCALIDSSRATDRCCALPLPLFFQHQRFASLASLQSVALLKEEQSLRVSLQHSVQLVGQVIEHVADVVQDVSCCLHRAAATVRRTGRCYKPADTVCRVKNITRNSFNWDRISLSLLSSR